MKIKLLITLVLSSFCSVTGQVDAQQPPSDRYNQSTTTKTLDLNDGNGQNGFVDEKTQSIGQP